MRSARPPQDRKFGCPKCEKKFFTPKDLRRHENTHLGLREHVCSSCHTRFGRKDHLTRHAKKSCSAIRSKQQHLNHQTPNNNNQQHRQSLSNQTGLFKPILTTHLHQQQQQQHRLLQQQQQQPHQQQPTQPQQQQQQPHLQHQQHQQQALPQQQVSQLQQLPHMQQAQIPLLQQQQPQITHTQPQQQTQPQPQAHPQPQPSPDQTGPLMPILTTQLHHQQQEHRQHQQQNHPQQQHYHLHHHHHNNQFVTGCGVDLDRCVCDYWPTARQNSPIQDEYPRLTNGMDEFHNYAGYYLATDYGS